MDAVEMLKETNRMTNKCQINCMHCEFKSGCIDMKLDEPEKYVEIVENWSKAHPQKTQADLSFERYPNAVKDENGIPEMLPCYFGFLCENSAECCKFESCDDCRKKYWSAPVEG